MRRVCRGAVVGLIVLLALPAVALGQSADAQRATEAQTLFDQASVDMDEGRVDLACQKFEQVTRLVPDGVGGKFALGECYEALGKLASAWTQFSFAEQVAFRLGQTDRAEEARVKAEALKPKLASLSVVVPEALARVPGLLVRRDGVDLREPQWGAPMFVDKGRHDVVVMAPGYTTWTKRVEIVADGAAASLSVPEKAIVVDPNAEQPGVARIVPIVVAPPPADRSWQRPLGIVATGTGLATLLSGGILAGLAYTENKASNANGHCDVVTNQCDEIGKDHRNRAITLGNAATGLLAAGVIVAAGGALVWATAPQETATKPVKKTKTSLHVQVTPSSVMLRGTF